VEDVLVRAARAVIGWLVITYTAHAVAESMPRRKLPTFVRNALKKQQDQLVTGLLKILILFAFFGREYDKLAGATAALFAVEIVLGPGRQWIVHKRVKKSARGLARKFATPPARQQGGLPSPVVGFRKASNGPNRCGASTKEGGRCRQRVAAPGQRCFHHR
jgi:hypothetical protein